MRRLLIVIGIVFSVLYLVAVFYVIGGRLDSLYAMRLNEIGDFLAGVFGPIAILWLVLGFFQQGIELQLSTKALELQAIELRRSVEQQRELVAVTREQLRTELDALRFERQARRDAAKPNLILYGVGANVTGDGKVRTKATFKNVGNTATLVRVNASPSLENLSPKSVPSIARNEEIRISFDYSRSEPFRNSILTFAFTDANGEPDELSFGVRQGTTRETVEFDLLKG
jgi:hypothetical protein